MMKFLSSKLLSEYAIYSKSNLPRVSCINRFNERNCLYEYRLMKKNIFNSLLLMLLLMVGLSSCTDTQLVQGDEATVLPNGDILLKTEVTVLDAPQVNTRSIDPDGLVITNIWFLCFDANGSYIGRRQATITPKDIANSSYSLTVSVPQSTRKTHVIGNLDLDGFNAPAGISETTLIPTLVSSSGRMTYWARKEFTGEPTNDDINGLQLLSNQAKVSFVNNTNNSLTVEGFALCNVRAWGTTAPFNPNAENPFDFDLENFNNLYITSPDAEHLQLSPDPEDVLTTAEQYLFEDPNTLLEPVFAIFKIKSADQQSSKYYKIMFVDDESNMLPIYRGYNYKININGVPQEFGYATFEEAKNGTAANNAWVSIDPEVPSLSDGTNSLDIPGGVSYVYTTGGDVQIPFTYKGTGTVSVSWLQNDGSVSASAPSLSEPVESETGVKSYNIKVSVAQPGENLSKGVILLRAGSFTRYVNVFVMKEMEFKPVLVSSPIPQNKGEYVTMTFSIPDNYPEELLPITCKIATNRMNPVNMGENHFTTIVEKCEFQITHTDSQTGQTTVDTHTTDWGYKFVYTINKPGVQEVHFTMNSSLGSDPEGSVTGCKEPSGVAHTHIFLEADYFKDEEAIVHFQDAGSLNNIRLIGDDINSVTPPGHSEQSVLPTANQEVTCGLYFEGQDVPAETYMRVSTKALKYLKVADAASGVEVVDSITSGSTTDYWLKFTKEFTASETSVLNLKFLTRTAGADDYVRFFIDEGYKGTENTQKYKSATLALSTEDAFDFSLTMNSNEIPYGVGQPIALTFKVPADAISTTDLNLQILTDNLEVDPSEPYYEYIKPLPNGGGYELTIPKGSQMVSQQGGTLHFLTTRIASADNVTLRTADNTQALFTPFVGSFANTPATGTISLPETATVPLDQNSFIALERKNGTRVGVFNITSSGLTANYALTLRPEYDFTMDETLTVYYYNLVSNKTFEATTTFNDLLTTDYKIQLKEK